jgi:GGDEF domain-containing protein
MRNGDDADNFAELLQHQLAAPILVGREALVVETCVGIAVYGSDDLHDMLSHVATDELMKRAGLAMSARAGPGKLHTTTTGLSA